MNDDQLIWNKIVEGDVNALRQLHDKYYYQLLLWANKHVQGSDLAEELVSDCFIKLWERRGQIFIEKSLKSYLFLMLRNHIASYHRQTKQTVVVNAETIPDVPDEATANQLEFYSELYQIILKIPAQRRQILELAAFESLSYQEIATKLNISVNTVKTQMGRAYQFLKEELDPKNFLLFSLFCRSVKKI